MTTTDAASLELDRTIFITQGMCSYVLVRHELGQDWQGFGDSFKLAVEFIFLFYQQFLFTVWILENACVPGAQNVFEATKPDENLIRKPTQASTQILIPDQLQQQLVQLVYTM